MADPPLTQDEDEAADASGMRAFVAELWHYRELFYFFAWRDIKIRYRQTLLGILWAVIQPVLTMVVFTILFGRFARMPSDGVPHPVFYFSALLPWIFFSATLTSASTSLIRNADLLTKIYFPRVILPVSATLAGLLDFAIGSAVLVGIMLFYGILPRWHVALWPLLALPLLVLTLGVGMFLAALNVRYRDVRYAMPFLIQLWLFVTPVIYPASLVPAPYRRVLALNPLTGLIEAFRYAIVPDRAMDWSVLVVSGTATLAIFALALAYFRKTEKVFADII